MLKPHDERIARIFRNVPDLPSLPAAAQRLLQLPEKDATPRHFAEIIGTDQGLTGKVLRLVNSAFYSLRVPISSLQHASSLLGTKTLKSMALSISVLNVFQRGGPGFELRQFWRHSMAVAVASQRLARRWAPPHEEDLYVTGLLHDAGAAVLAQALAADYSQVLAAAKQGRSLSQVEQEAFGVSHARIGHHLSTRWRLPALIGECVLHHETPAAELGSLAPEVRLPVELLKVADTWSHKLGFTFLPEAALEACPLPEWLEPHRETLVATLAGLGEEIAALERCYLPSAESVATEVTA